METRFTRRRLIAFAAATGAIVSVPAGAVARWGPVRRLFAQGGCAGGQELAGFLLLSETEPTPTCVVGPALPDPTVCGAEKDPGPMARTEAFDTGQALADTVAFPVYDLGVVPAGLEPDGASLIRHPGGEPFTATVRYRHWNAGNGSWDTVVEVWSTPDFPRPCPLRAIDPDPEDGPGARGGLALQPVAYLPQPGILVEADGGFVGHWIHDDVLYRLVDDHSANRAQAEALAAGLTRLV